MTPQRAPNMPEIRLGQETETGRGWHYSLDIAWPDGSASSHQSTLSWADHDHLCGGTQAPSRVMEAVIRFALDNLKASLPGKFDTSTVRRWCPALDSELVL